MRLVGGTNHASYTVACHSASDTVRSLVTNGTDVVQVLVTSFTVGLVSRAAITSGSLSAGPLSVLIGSCVLRVTVASDWTRAAGTHASSWTMETVSTGHLVISSGFTVVS